MTFSERYRRKLARLQKKKNIVPIPQADTSTAIPVQHAEASGQGLTLARLGSRLVLIRRHATDACQTTSYEASDLEAAWRDFCSDLEDLPRKQALNTTVQIVTSAFPCGRFEDDSLFHTFRIRRLPALPEGQDGVLAQWTAHDSPAPAHNQVRTLEGSRQKGISTIH